MDRQYIVNGNRIEFSVDEMVYLVSEYIYDKKGKSINIDVVTCCINPSIRGGFNILMYKSQITKLIKAFNVALVHYKQYDKRKH